MVSHVVCKAVTSKIYHRSSHHSLATFASTSNSYNHLNRSPQMDTRLEPYVHAPITQDDTIRLITLQPSKNLEAGLVCNLNDNSLTECDHEICTSFTALSYVWGDVKDRVEILVDDRVLSITASLDSALRHVRDESCVLYIWADGICIDQQRSVSIFSRLVLDYGSVSRLEVDICQSQMMTDDHNSASDKATQVRQMGSIYSKAQHTIIYLGPLTPSIDSFLKLPVSTERKTSPKTHQDYITDQDYIMRAGLALNELTSRRWFSRI